MQRLTLKKLISGIMLMLLMVPTISKANPLPYVVEFVVLNQKQQPITDAIITLELITNPPGDYFFGLYAPGFYSYMVAREGYENAVGLIHVIENNYEPIIEEVILYILCGFIIHDTSGPAGENILIETQIINTGFQFISFQVDIILPEGFGYVPGSAFLNPERKADHIVNASVLPGTNTLRMISFSLTNSAFLGEWGIIASFTLTTTDVTGNYQLLTENFVGVPCPNPISLPGAVILTLPGLLPGDSNCDGEVDVMDVITTINYIIGANPQPFCFENADVNGDGAVDALDVIGTIDIILSGDFICGFSTITDIDGNVYNTVQIGEQCWMKENLKTTRDAAGNNITRYCYDNNVEFCNWYGGLYTWYTIMNGASSSNSNPSGVQGICPDGWHVPSHHEWTQLEQFICEALGNSHCDSIFPYDHSTYGWRGTIEGNALKSCRQVNSPLGGDCNTEDHPRWNSDETHHGTDVFGFSSLPGGIRNAWGHFFENLGSYGFWWSSTWYSAQMSAWCRYMYKQNGNIGRSYGNRSHSEHLRCLRDID